MGMGQGGGEIFTASSRDFQVSQMQANFNHHIGKKSSCLIVKNTVEIYFEHYFHQRNAYTTSHWLLQLARQ